jgi:hypothetical protein
MIYGRTHQKNVSKKMLKYKKIVHQKEIMKERRKKIMVLGIIFRRM